MAEGGIGSFYLKVAGIGKEGLRDRENKRAAPLEAARAIFENGLAYLTMTKSSRRFFDHAASSCPSATGCSLP